MSDAFGGVVFPFEDLGDALNLLPLAARRALDVAGYRLSLEAWQSLATVDRATIALEGAKDGVDAQTIEGIVKRASVTATRIKPVPDPDALTPPEQLNAALAALASEHDDDRAPTRIAPSEWSRLRALDRYALLHVLRRSIAHDDPRRLSAAVEAVLSRAATPRDAREDFKRTMRSNPQAQKHPADISIDLERASDSSRRVSDRPRTSEKPRPPSTRPGPEEDAMTVRPGDSPGSTRDEIALTHVDKRGAVHMVDVGDKAITPRRAIASGVVRMRRETAERIARGDAPKGEVVATARVAGIMAAKRTSEIIPLCHSIALTKVEVAIHVDVAAGRCEVVATVEASDRTGVEMEALTATSVACLTIYDMLKAIDRDMVVSEIKLVEKTGGRSGSYVRDDGR